MLHVPLHLLECAILVTKSVVFILVLVPSTMHFSSRQISGSRREQREFENKDVGKIEVMLRAGGANRTLRVFPARAKSSHNYYIEIREKYGL